MFHVSGKNIPEMTTKATLDTIPTLLYVRRGSIVGLLTSLQPDREGAGYFARDV